MGIGASRVRVLAPSEMVKVEETVAALKFAVEAELTLSEHVPAAVQERVVPVIAQPAVPGVPTVVSA